jgi:hypothetical protein
VHRKDWCWSVRVVYVLEKVPDVSMLSLEEVGCYTIQIYVSTINADLGTINLKSTVHQGQVPVRRSLKCQHYRCECTSEPASIGTINVSAWWRQSMSPLMTLAHS